LANFCDNCGAKHVFFQRTCFECGNSLGGANFGEIAGCGCFLYTILGIAAVVGVVLLFTWSNNGVNSMINKPKKIKCHYCGKFFISVRSDPFTAFGLQCTYCNEYPGRDPSWDIECSKCGSINKKNLRYCVQCFSKLVSGCLFPIMSLFFIFLLILV